MLKKFDKTTNGWVNQHFERNGDGEFHCTEQSFFAGDPVEYEGGEYGEPLSEMDKGEAIAGEKYQPFDMVQPIMVYLNLIVHGDVEPELSGPFEDWDAMVSAAEQHRESDPEQKDGIYHLTIPKGVHVEINTFCGKRD